MQKILIILLFLIIAIFPSNVMAGSAIKLNGSNQRVKFGGTSFPALGNVFTVEGFFKRMGPGPTSTNWQALFERQKWSHQEWGIFMNRDTDRVGATINYDGNHSGSQTVWLGGDQFANATSTFNKWNHVALVGTGTQFRLYLNGKLVDSKPQTAAPLLPTTETPVVTAGGLDEGGTAEPFDGAVDEFRISNIARYTENTYTIYTYEFYPDVNTLGLWHFNEGTGNTTSDFSNHGYTGSVFSDTSLGNITWTDGVPFGGYYVDIDWIRNIISGPINVIDYNEFVSFFGKIKFPPPR